MKPISVHGTCVEIKSNAVLICGQSGSGKSSLALQLIDRGALLVSDDQTFLTLEKGVLITSSPPSLKGLMEIRGIGICSFPYQTQSPLKLCVELCENSQFERLPSPAFVEYYECKVPLLKLQRNDPLAAIKVELKIDGKDAPSLV